MFDTDKCFKSGKMTITSDLSAGSSGKGVLNAWLCKHANNWQFACNAFMSNAAHWVETSDGTRRMYQCLNSCAYSHKYEKLYICGGAVIELPALLREIEENDLNEKLLGIHPLVGIVQKKDVDYESGRANFDGDLKNIISDNLKIGSTLHGVGAARARRILRRSDVLLARDIPELKPFICDTREEIISRLDQGQAGLLEIAQGFSLGYLEQRFYPKTTSRNCTTAAGLDDCGIPPYYAGPIILNARTYPIRVNSNKYLHKKTRKILTQSEMDELSESEVEIIHGDSGASYKDQSEITWNDISKSAGREIVELSSLTKLPRRVFTFSAQNLREAIRYNKTVHETYISLNFVNYVDPGLWGQSGSMSWDEINSKKLKVWDREHTFIETCKEQNAQLLCLGTGPKNDEMIQINS